MQRGEPPTKVVSSVLRLSPETIRVERRSWHAWVTCLGRSETRRDDRRVSCSPFKRGGLAAKQMPRLRPRRLALRTKEKPLEY